MDDLADDVRDEIESLLYAQIHHINHDDVPLDNPISNDPITDLICYVSSSDEQNNSPKRQSVYNSQVSNVCVNNNILSLVNTVNQTQLSHFGSSTLNEPTQENVLLFKSAIHTDTSQKNKDICRFRESKPRYSNRKRRQFRRLEREKLLISKRKQKNQNTKLCRDVKTVLESSSIEENSVHYVDSGSSSDVMFVDSNNTDEIISIDSEDTITETTTNLIDSSDLNYNNDMSALKNNNNCETASVNSNTFDYMENFQGNETSNEFNTSNFNDFVLNFNSFADYIERNGKTNNDLSYSIPIYSSSETEYNDKSIQETNVSKTINDKIVIFSPPKKSSQRNLQELNLKVKHSRKLKKYKLGANSTEKIESSVSKGVSTSTAIINTKSAILRYSTQSPSQPKRFRDYCVNEKEKMSRKIWERENFNVVEERKRISEMTKKAIAAVMMRIQRKKKLQSKHEKAYVKWSDEAGLDTAKEA